MQTVPQVLHFTGHFFFVSASLLHFASLAEVHKILSSVHWSEFKMREIVTQCRSHLMVIESGRCDDCTVTWQTLYLTLTLNILKIALDLGY
jgi:hypothetical protein